MSGIVISLHREVHMQMTCIVIMQRQSCIVISLNIHMQMSNLALAFIPEMNGGM